MTIHRRQSFFVAILSCLALKSTHALISGSARDLRISGDARSHVELIEPSTKCQVVLLGCLHGSSSSSDDVRRLLCEPTDVVVLELCATRFSDLRRARSSFSTIESKEKRGVMQNFVQMVRKTTERKGWATGVAAAVLGGASGIQTALSGFEAGSEFSTALEIASTKDCDVILADRAVDETLRRVGSLPFVSLDMLREGSFQNESKALHTAIFGESSLRESQQINMPRVLARNGAVRQDMLRLMLPPLILAQLLVGLGQGVLYMMGSGNDFSPSSMELWNPLLLADLSLSSAEMLSVAKDILTETFTSVLMLVLGYRLLALPATRVILCERDDPLADGIRTACKVAVSRNGGDASSARVVAVLGLLHVNGVAQRLLDATGGDTLDDRSGISP